MDNFDEVNKKTDDFYDDLHVDSAILIIMITILIIVYNHFVN